MQQTELNPNPPKVDFFEQKVVFGSIRVGYLLLSATAIVSIAIAVAMGVYGNTPVVEGEEPPQPALVAPKPVDAESLKRALSALTGDDEEMYMEGNVDREYEEVESVGDGYDPTWDANEEALAQMFDQPTKYPYKDGSECARYGWGDRCMQYKRKRGALSVLRESYKLIPRHSDAPGTHEAKIAALAAKLVAVAAPNDDSRFVYVGLLKDLMYATDGRPNDAVAAIEAVLSAHASWDEETRNAFAVGLITAETKGAGSAQLTALIEQTPEILGVFSPDTFAEAIKGAWSVTKDMSPSAAKEARSLLLSVAKTQPIGYRKLVFTAYTQTLESNAETAMAENLRLRSAWDEKVQERMRDIALAEQGRAEARATSLNGIVMGTGALCVLGMLLAVLSVERNTRRTEALLRALQPANRPNEGDQTDALALTDDAPAPQPVA